MSSDVCFSSSRCFDCVRAQCCCFSVCQTKRTPAEKVRFLPNKLLILDQKGMNQFRLLCARDAGVRFGEASRETKPRLTRPLVR